MLDNTYHVETPEGIDLHAEIAGPVPRILAYSIDILIRFSMLAIISIPLFMASKTGMGVFLILTFLAEWFYPVLFEVLRGGQTPGKKAMGLTVVNDDLTPISWGTSIVRNLLRAADFLPFAYLGGIISMTASRHFQRLGDIAAGTLVIYKHEIKEASNLPDVKPSMPPPDLTLNDQQAIMNFTQRHESLSNNRQKELAGILENTFQSGSNQPVNSEDHRVRTLRSWGVWFMGKR